MAPRKPPLSLAVGFLGLCALALAGLGYAVSQAPDTSQDTDQLPACTSEDTAQLNCYWDAHAHGNHKGWSFVIVNDQVYYVGLDVEMDHGRPYLITHESHASEHVASRYFPDNPGVLPRVAAQPNLTYWW